MIGWLNLLSNKLDVVSDQFCSHIFLFLESLNQSFRTLKFRSYGFRRLRHEQILVEFRKGGVIRPDCFVILFGGNFQFFIGLSVIKVGGLQIRMLRIKTVAVLVACCLRSVRVWSIVPPSGEL
jgi:hypothetical protein